MKGALALRNPCGSPAVLNTGNTNVTSGAWVELKDSMEFACSGILVTNQGIEPLEIGKGESGSEEPTGAVIPPQDSVIIPINLPASTRLSLRSMGATQSLGFVTATFLQ